MERNSFPQNFGRIARNFAETVPFHKISTFWKLGEITTFYAVNVGKASVLPKTFPKISFCCSDLYLIKADRKDQPIFLTTSSEAISGDAP